MMPENEKFEAKPIDLNATVPSVLDAQLKALREMALALAREVESVHSDPMLDLENGINLSGVIRRYEINLIKRALSITNGNQQKASELLGLKPTTLNAKLKRYDLGRFPRFGQIKKSFPREGVQLNGPWE